VSACLSFARRPWLRAVRWLVLSGVSMVDAPDALAETGAPSTPAEAPTNEDDVEAPSERAGSLAAPPASASSSATEEPDRAPGVAPPEKAAEASAAADDERGKKKRDADGERSTHLAGKVRTRAGQIQLKGRVVARAELQRRPRHVLEGSSIVSVSKNSLDLSMQSVRVGVDYEAPMRWLTAVAELELTGKPSLKDGYVQARAHHWFVRAGQFKMPTSAIESESPWVLPLASRGLIHDLLTDWLDVGGRRPGAVVGFRSGAPWHLRLSGGAFQGSVVSNSDRDTDLIKNRSLDAQSLVGRAQIDVGPVAIGAWYEHRVGSPALDQYDYYPTGGLDATLEQRLPNGAVRAWVEGIAGKSWLELARLTSDSDITWFATARALLAWRFGGTSDEAPYLEPFGFLGVFDPDRHIRNDIGWEAAVGLNAGFWQRARLTLQGEISRAQSNFPSGFRLGTGYLSTRDPDHIGLLLQAGVAW
jgi:hypothetical protein